MVDVLRMFVKILILACLARDYSLFCLSSLIATVEECSIIEIHGRKACLHDSNKPISTKNECQQASCCWDNGICFSPTECALGHYGWRCHLKCQCSSDEPCKRQNGLCTLPCPIGHWGVGCLLDDRCTYNDPQGLFYMGHQQTSHSNQRCQSWHSHRAYSLNHFPDRITHIRELSNYCRNPTSNPSSSPWCYDRFNDKQTCDLQECTCPQGRYNSSCSSECHCADVREQCQRMTGVCALSGCHSRWSGPSCSICADGFFGEYCEYMCRCRESKEVCDKGTGVCKTGCASGWYGNNCLHECNDGYFGLNCEHSCNCKDDREVCDKRIGHCASGCKAQYGAEGCLIFLPKLAKPIWVQERSASQVTLAWHDWHWPSYGLGRGPILGYRVSYKLALAQDWSLAGDTKNSSTFRISNLVMESSYEFRVAPVHDSGTPGLPSDVLRIKTCGKPLGTVSDLSATSQGHKSDNYTNILLVWKAPKKENYNCDSVSKYHIYISNTTLPPPTTFPTTTITTKPLFPLDQSLRNMTVPSTETSASQATTTAPSIHFLFPLFSQFHFHSQINKTRSTLPRMQLYHNLFIAVTFFNNAAFESDPSYQQFIGKSSAVEALKAVGNSSSSIVVSWRPPAQANAPIQSYSLSYRLMSDLACQGKKGSWSHAILLESDKTQYVISKLSIYSMYQIKVTPKTRAGVGKQLLYTATTLPEAPTERLKVKVTQTKTSWVQLRWASVACRKWKGAIKGYVYEVYKRKKAPVAGGCDGVDKEADGKENISIPSGNTTTSRNSTTANNMTFLFTGEVSKQNVSDEVTLDIKNLVPYVHYTVHIWMTNQLFAGPKATVKFTTKDDVPTAPGGLRVKSRSSESLHVCWRQPDPPQGIITTYQLKYVAMTGTSESNAEYYRSNSSVFSYNITGLKPYHKFAMQVRAASSKGYGPWSATLIEYTMEALPTEPLNLRNVSRGSDHVSLQWQLPLQENGLIKFYSVTCNPVSAIGCELATPIDKKVEAPHLEVSLQDLQPGINYECRVAAVNSIGEGPSSYILFWTEPLINFVLPVPYLEDESSSEVDDVMLVKLKPASSIQYMEEPDSLYRVVVERYGVGAFQRRFKRLVTGKEVEKVDAKKRGALGVNEERKEEGMSGVEEGVSGAEKGVSRAEEEVGGVKERVSGVEVGMARGNGSGEEAGVVKMADEEGSSMLSANKTVSAKLQEEVEKLPADGITDLPIQSSVPPLNSHLPKTPCNLSHSQLVDYATAMKRRLNCYIAAELPRVAHELDFVVGDNKTHGGYYNAKLHSGGEYDVWYGLVVTVDGVTVSSYSKTQKPRTDVYVGGEEVQSLYIPTDAPSVERTESVEQLPVIVACVASLLLLVLLVLVLYLVIVRRSLRRGGKRDSNVMVYETYPGMPVEQSKKLLGHPSELAAGAGGGGGGGVARQAIAVSQLWNYVVPRKQFGDDLIRAEYSEFQQDLVFKADEALKKENRNKNRYINIVAYDHSRVVLDAKPTVTSSSSSSPSSSSYINANYIHGYERPQAYIAAQGPTKNTLEDTWRMVWQLHCDAIVMLTNFTEAGRNKCELYWPEEGRTVYGEVEVELKSLQEFADFKIREFSVSKVDGDLRTVHQFHFTTWPDHGVPVNPTSLLEFRKKVRSYLPDEDSTTTTHSSSPVLVHCSAGVGRTGTYIALDSLLQQAKLHDEVNVYEFVRKMRQDRVNMVQTIEQYIFIYDALLEALQASTTSTPCSEFRSRYAHLNKTNPDTQKLYLQEEFEMLGSSKHLYRHEDAVLDALLAENIAKNRDVHIVPDNYSRIRMSGGCGGSRPDYINAIHVDGYKQGNAFIVTQTPLSTTTNDFWCTMVEQGCCTIICLQDPDQQENSLEDSYCPAKAFHTEDPLETDKTFKMGAYSGTLLSSTSSAHFTQQEFSLKYDSKIHKKNSSTAPIEQVVKRFVVRDWEKGEKVEVVEERGEKEEEGGERGGKGGGKGGGEGGGVVWMPSRGAMLSLFRALEKWQQKSGNHTVVVHCRDGAMYSGLFCAASYLVERLKTEHEIDVFTGVRHVSVNRNHFITDLNQYRYLYDLLIDFLDCFDTYANFEAGL